ncbi:ComF family protein [Tumebacillus permanentifrigoris]|uniref:ComF family protein n=1 Tax=Tumebacillus permanentifrigoris TaxID=378543 RepID=A0A316DDZ9_9BACL|nr:double zinc ribbon domain-containing protein [Tumebacillus permanentifrigoris]PWK16195.1 ComF family protein [Tumebacillus permanentifrigoris]
MKKGGWWDALVGLLYPEPRRCLFCRHNFIQDPEEVVCAPCLRQVTESVPPLCRVCGREQSGRGVCDDCRRRREAFFQRAVSYGPYRGRLRALLLALKKDRHTSVVPILAGFLEQVWAAELADRGVEVFVPVPIARDKLQERGFNQALLLAEAVGERVRVPVCEALTWQGARRAQVSRNRAQRLDSMEDSLGLSPEAAAVAGRVVCLLDDIYTTGATANACAKKLHEAGARAVYVITVAR